MENYQNHDLPIKSPEGKPKVGLVLSGGGARTCSYIGVYEVLIKHQIPIDIICGTSIGALIGGMISMGYNPEMIKKSLVNFGKKDIISFKNFNYFHESLFKSTALDDLLLNFAQNKNIEETKIPFGCVAVNLESRKKVEFTSGSLRHSLRASSAMPLIFPPEFYDDKYLIDGGVLDNTPALLARKMGADKLIIIKTKSNKMRQEISAQIFKRHMQNKTILNKLGINGDLLHKELSIFHAFKEKKEDIKFMIEIFWESLNIASKYTSEAIIKKAKPDITLEILINLGLMDFEEENIEQAIQAGKEYALNNIEKIKKQISQ